MIKRIILWLLRKTSSFWPDELFVRIKFRLLMGTSLDLKNPKTFNEKLQWIKLYDRKPLYVEMADKVKSKEFVAKRIGEKYIIPNIGVWKDPEDIVFEELPNQFVIKCNHNSGSGMFICKDKSKVTAKKWKTIKKGLYKGLKENYYLHSREWPYKDVPRRIIAEELIIDNKNKDKALIDYKFFCFNGKADCVMLCLERETGSPKFYFFNRQWELMRCNKLGKTAPEGFTLPKPDNIDEMFDIADKLSLGCAFLRVDLYNVNNRVYFGEMTFFPASGMDPNLLTETDKAFGNAMII